MSLTGLPAFDETLHNTNVWLKEVMERLGSDDRHRAYLALRAALHALRDRLPPEDAVHLGAQLPMLVRGFYYEGWKPSATPSADRMKDEFLEHIRDEFRHDPDADVEATATSVFAVLAERLTEGETRKVMHLLPAQIRELWPTGGAAPSPRMH